MDQTQVNPPDAQLDHHPVVITAPIHQPWWLGSLLCIFVVATSHFGLLQLFGNVAYGTTFALLITGIYMGILGIWKTPDQFTLSMLALSLNSICIGVVGWMLFFKH